MDLKTFQEVHGKDSMQSKLFLFARTMERIGDCRVAVENARRNLNKEEEAYYDREARAMDQRAQWLYSELWNELDRQENDWR